MGSLVRGGPYRCGAQRIVCDIELLVIHVRAARGLIELHLDQVPLSAIPARNFGFNAQYKKGTTIPTRVQSFSNTARALAVLVHVSWHLNGIADEGLTNCYAFQSGVTIGVHLDLSESRARAMMREQLATNASDSAGDSRYLVPPSCRDGGEYDLHPASDRFP
jgi:hypothetical protein